MPSSTAPDPGAQSRLDEVDGVDGGNGDESPLCMRSGIELSAREGFTSSHRSSHIFRWSVTIHTPTHLTVLRRQSAGGRSATASGVRRTPPCSTLDRSVCEGCLANAAVYCLGVTRRDRLRSAPAVPIAHAPRWPRRTVGYSTSRPTGSSGRVAAIQLREPLCYGKSPEGDIEIFSCRSRLFRIRGGTSTRAGSRDGNWRDGCGRR